MFHSEFDFGTPVDTVDFVHAFGSELYPESRMPAPRMGDLPADPDSEKWKKIALILVALILVYAAYKAGSSTKSNPKRSRRVYRRNPEMEDEVEEESEDQPEEDDAYLSPSGALGAKVSLSVDGKHLGEFEDEAQAERVLKTWMSRHKFYPNVWWVDDHGSVRPYELEE